ncbi:hypothetical protein IJE86_04880 [bacterium]|nr:hypothetical protein [bacterium]
MAVTPNNELDKKLASIYAQKVTVNLDRTSSLSPDDFWKSMSFIAVTNKALINFKAKKDE